MLAHEIRGDGRTLVFVHGLTLDRRVLVEAFEPAFAECTGFRRIYLDLPGHGESPAGSTAPSAEGLLEALQEPLTAVAGPQPLLVAHAYGAYLAQGLLALGGDVGGLFLVAPVVEPDLGARRMQPQRYALVEDGLDYASDEESSAFE